MIIVRKSEKRRCPSCYSNKWEYLSCSITKPYLTQDTINLDTGENVRFGIACYKPECLPKEGKELSGELLSKYRCQKCRNEFLVEENFKEKLVENIDRCFYCQSKYVEFVSEIKGQAVVLSHYRCKHCGAFMAKTSEIKGRENLSTGTTIIFHID